MFSVRGGPSGRPISPSNRASNFAAKQRPQMTAVIRRDIVAATMHRPSEFQVDR